MNSSDDKFGVLMQRVLAGDQEAAWELVETYEPHIRRVVRHALAPRVRSFLDSVDVAQSVWASLLRHPGRLDQFTTHQQLIAYLAGMARNKVLEEHRRWLDRPTSGEKTTVSLDSISPDCSAMRTGDTPSKIAIARERWDRLIESQPPKYQELLRLRLQGFRQVEIAKRLNVSERTVRRVLKRLAELDDAPSSKASYAGRRENHVAKSAILAAALEEYTSLREAGRQVNDSDFCRTYPSHRSSVRRLLSVHQHLADHPEIVEALEQTDWPEPGQQFLGFELREELGRGTFARVFLAVEPALGDREVVLKVASCGVPEAEILAKLDHPNVVRVYSAQTDLTTGLSAICMPSAGRRTLSDVLDNAFSQPTVSKHASPPTTDHLSEDHSLTVRSLGLLGLSAAIFGGLRSGQLRSWADKVVNICRTLADALAYTHSRGILHLDLKPSNILINDEGQPILIDFNLSQDPRDDASRVGGTPPYMAPEQLRAFGAASAKHGETMDPRTDVYALGVILYEALTGRLPFGRPDERLDSEQLVGEMLCLRRTKPVAARHRNPRVDSKLSNIVERCLAYDPAERFQSADELADHLRSCLTPAARLKRLVETRRVALVRLAACGALGLFVTVSVWSLLAWHEVAQFSFFRSVSIAADHAFTVGPVSGSVVAPLVFFVGMGATLLLGRRRVDWLTWFLSRAASTSFPMRLRCYWIAKHQGTAPIVFLGGMCGAAVCGLWEFPLWVGLLLGSLAVSLLSSLAYGINERDNQELGR